MTYKLLLALAMSAVVLVGCRASKPEVENNMQSRLAALVYQGGDYKLTPLEEKRMNQMSRDAQPSRLHQLCASRDATVAQIQEVLDLGADVNEKSFWVKWTPLMGAAMYTENPEVISVLLEAGADVNAKGGGGMTALMLAVEKTNPEVVTMLLEAGADVNARNHGTRTPLMLAVGTTNLEVISILLRAGADVNARDDHDTTPLMWTIGNTNPEVLTLLLKADADVNAKNVLGRTLLMFEAEHNTNPEVISVLLRAGADVNARDNYGKTALDWAKDNESIKGTQALKELEEATNP